MQLMGDNLNHLQDHMCLTTHITSSQEWMGQLEHWLGQVRSVLMGMIEGAIEREGIAIRHYFCSYFLSIVDPTSLHILYPPFSFMIIFVMFLSFMPFTLMNRRQEHDSIGTTSHQTTRLLDYQHPEIVLLWFLLNLILCWNLLCHRTLPPLKVPDFPDTEHK